MSKKKNVLLKVLGIVLGVILALFLIFTIAVRVYFRAPVRSYYKNCEKGFKIPGINDNIVAQGLFYDEKSEQFYICGYMSDETASPIYIVDKKTKKLVQTVRMANPDGSDFLGHAGGLSILNGKVYVAGGEKCCLYVFDQNEIKNAENNSSVKYKEVINLFNEKDGLGIAFTTIHNDMIYAGEFYREPQYPCAPSHSVVTSDGSTNHALTVAFKLVDGKPVLQSAISIPGLVQGMEFNNGKIYLSTSWSVAMSNIYVYDEALMEQKGEIEVLGEKLPLYVLDNSNLIESIKIAPMSEEMVIVDGKCYVMCESASNKYKFGKFTGGKWCYAMKL